MATLAGGASMFTLPMTNLLLKVSAAGTCTHARRKHRPCGPWCACWRLQVGGIGTCRLLLPGCPVCVQDAAISGALGTAPAQVLNAGQLLAALPHLAVLLPMLMGE